MKNWLHGVFVAVCVLFVVAGVGLLAAAFLTGR